MIIFHLYQVFCLHYFCFFTSNIYIIYNKLNGEAVMELLRELHHGGATICMVTHDPRAAARADRVVYLADGRIVADQADPTDAGVLAQMKAVAR